MSPVCCKHAIRQEALELLRVALAGVVEVAPIKIEAVVVPDRLAFELLVGTRLASELTESRTV